jgi:hypothetical protein
MRTLLHSEKKKCLKCSHQFFDIFSSMFEFGQGSTSFSYSSVFIDFDAPRLPFIPRPSQKLSSQRIYLLWLTSESPRGTCTTREPPAPECPRAPSSMIILYSTRCSTRNWHTFVWRCGYPPASRKAIPCHPPLFFLAHLPLLARLSSTPIRVSLLVFSRRYFTGKVAVSHASLSSPLIFD